jgi:hypothetical protein
MKLDYFKIANQYSECGVFAVAPTWKYIAGEKLVRFATFYKYPNDKNQDLPKYVEGYEVKIEERERGDETGRVL